MVFGITAVAVSQPDESRPGDSFIHSFFSGFRVEPELKAITDLKEQGKFREAYRKATEIIERPNKSFCLEKKAANLLRVTPEEYCSIKHVRSLKEEAFFMRGEIAIKLGGKEANKRALSDMKASAALGNRSAYYQVGARLLIQSKNERDKSLKKTLYDEAFTNFLNCAELGDPTCMDLVRQVFRVNLQIKNEQYWFLLGRMAEGHKKALDFESFYKQSYSKMDLAFLDSIMREFSISGGKVESNITGLPGRSTLTTAAIDLYLRRQLSEINYLHFKSDKKGLEMSEVFAGYRKMMRTYNPLLDVRLLTNKRYSSNEQAIQLAADHLIKNIYPGDQIFVRCGHLIHYSVVWSIDHAKQKFLLLDPFHEFWLPSHNRCVKTFKLTPYKHGRFLVQGELSDLKRMLVAVMTLRDRK